MLAANWQALGLSRPLDGADNGVHASASPLEGYAERVNFLGLPSAESDECGFGPALLRLGLSEEQIHACTRDPQVNVPSSLAASAAAKEGGDGQGPTVASLFDTVEDMDQEPCLAVCYAVTRGQQCGKVARLPVPLRVET